ncbi:MAG: cysteine desulfurase [Ruminococcaceae bacterium]|nr:cysteine desulfurase [Oscillospiraceae bacterium]
MFVYADHAATTPMSETAIAAMTEAMRTVWGNPSSLHTVGQEAKVALENAREEIASLLGATAKEITFTSGGSEADNQAIVSAAKLGAAKGKKHIVSTKFEHHAILHTLNKLEKEGYEVTYLDVHENGLVTPEQVKEAIRPDTALVTIMYANNEIGTLQPIREIGAVCRAAGVLFHTDAVQAIGHIAVDVVKDNIDLLSLSAHKFRGPKGVGILYARRGIRLATLIEGGAQERGKRAGTENIPAIVGMAAALKEAVANLEANTAKVVPLREKLITGLRKIPYSHLNGDRDARVPGIVNFCFEGIEGESLLLLLDMRGIACSSGSACTSGSLDPSHVLLSLGIPHEVAHGSLRISIDETNTEEQIDYILEAVPQVVSYLRTMSPVWEDLESGKRKHFFAK